MQKNQDSKEYLEGVLRLREFIKNSEEKLANLKRQRLFGVPFQTKETMKGIEDNFQF